MARKPPTLDTTIFEMVLDSGDVSARLRLAQELAALAGNPDAPEAEREAIQPILLRLADDPVRDVRVFLARSLAKVYWLADDVVMAIAADEPSVALQFIAEARALTEPRMLSLLGQGDDARQMIVASRGDIKPRVAEAVAERGGEAAVEALLGNWAAHFTPAMYKTIYRRFAQSETIVEILLTRADLPAMIRVLQARLARERLAAELLEKQWIASNRADELLIESEELALAAICAQAAKAEWRELASFLIHRGQMTASLFMRLAARGEAGFITAALEILTRARAGRRGAQRLVKRAGLPEPAAVILRLALDAAANGHGPAESFGLRIIERLTLAGDSIAPALRARALSILMEAGSVTTKQVAGALREKLGLAAAA